MHDCLCSGASTPDEAAAGNGALRTSAPVCTTRPNPSPKHAAAEPAEHASDWRQRARRDKKAAAGLASLPLALARVRRQVASCASRRAPQLLRP